MSNFNTDFAVIFRFFKDIHIALVILYQLDDVGSSIVRKVVSCIFPESTAPAYLNLAERFAK